MLKTIACWPRSSNRGSRKTLPKKRPDTSTIPSNYLSKVIRELEACPIIGVRDAASQVVTAVGESAVEKKESVSGAPPISDQPARSRPPKKVKVTVYLSPELRDRAKRAAAQLSDTLGRLSMSELARRGLERELTQLEKEHHGGRPFSAE